jgi:hypothetical protein
MKKVFAILLALSAISVVLSGCGGGSDAGTDTKPADTKTEETK